MSIRAVKIYKKSPAGTDRRSRRGCLLFCLFLIPQLGTMKLMNEIAAEEMGTVREVCLSDATPVEYGTVLFYVEPHDPTPGA